MPRSPRRLLTALPLAPMALGVAAVAVLAACASVTAGKPQALPSLPTPATATTPTPSVSFSTPVVRHRRHVTAVRPTPTHPAAPTTTSSAPANRHVVTHAVRPTGRLPLRLVTGDARQAVTVVASSTSSTTAVLRTWRKVGAAWHAFGPAVPARLGSDGLSTHASESRSATPIGSFTLTQAFGHDANPGTSLPYRQTTSADWWISQPGRLYNTEQHCASGCDFAQGDPNEHLYYETPYYDYAVVIDYNTADAPGGVRQGAGSAFFLHVSVDPTTQGCVSIPKDQLVQVMRWLRPAQHPRILIGVG